MMSETMSETCVSGSGSLEVKKKTAAFPARSRSIPDLFPPHVVVIFRCVQVLESEDVGVGE